MSEIKDLKQQNGMSCDARQSRMQAIAATARSMAEAGKSEQEIAEHLRLSPEEVRTCLGGGRTIG